MTKEEKFASAAYHESGHVVYTYLHGYACELVKILLQSPGQGVSKLFYGHDQLIASIVANSFTHGEHFNDLGLRDMMLSPIVAGKIASIMLAGTAAEVVYLHGGKVKDEMDAQISGPDLVTVKSVDHFLKGIKPNHDPNFINNRMASVMTTMGYEPIWKAISSLAEAILASEERGLLREDIEEVLEKCGFFAYREEIRTKKGK